MLSEQGSLKTPSMTTPSLTRTGSFTVDPSTRDNARTLGLDARKKTGATSSEARPKAVGNAGEAGSQTPALAEKQLQRKASSTVANPLRTRLYPSHCQFPRLRPRPSSCPPKRVSSKSSRSHPRKKMTGAWRQIWMFECVYCKAIAFFIILRMAHLQLTSFFSRSESGG